MIVHLLKLFFAGGFVAAGALQALLSSVGWLDAHGAKVKAPAFLTHDTPAVLLCVGAGLLFAFFSEYRRAAKGSLKV